MHKCVRVLDNTPFPHLVGILVHCRVAPSIKFGGIHLYTWVERGTTTVRESVLAQNTMQSPQPDLEPRLLNPDNLVISTKLKM